jgi:low affinity Fe/Cu permease
MTTAARPTRKPPHMPTDVTPDLSFFDRFATVSARFASRAWFFAACLMLVIVWAPSYFVIGSLDTWQLIINTATTIVTFLMVALLQNSQSRSEDAIHQKLDAIADALADMMETSRDANGGMRADVDDLRKAVGIEQVEGKETANA